MIYTSYFARMRYFPKDFVTISICLKVPEWYHGLQYDKLAPKPGFFSKWRQTRNNNYYIKCFNEQVLNTLNPQIVINELRDLADSAENIVLLCYERQEDFCHRHIVADWLTENGIPCQEWELDSLYSK